MLRPTWACGMYEPGRHNRTPRHHDVRGLIEWRNECSKPNACRPATHFHGRSFTRHFHVDRGQPVDLKRDDLLVALRLPRVEQDVDLHELAGRQHPGLAVDLQVGRVRVVALNAGTEKQKQKRGKPEGWRGLQDRGPEPGAPTPY